MLAGVLVACALLAVIVVLSSSGGTNGEYNVRAIFDDAGNVIPGEDVKIQGVRVGAVGEVVPTPAGRAAVELKISNSGFQDFREDASCTIRPQALIGEKYVDCTPTQPRMEGAPLPPPLSRIPSGREGAGQYMLPVTNTHSMVDPDLLNAITRLPQAQGLRIILNELGTGLAGRGSDLKEVIRRADPTLQEFDRVLKILAGENHVLVNLAEESDRALAPIAASRNRLSDFIAQSNTVARASSNTTALRENLARLPVFLEVLGPAMRRLGKFAEETTPTFTDLGAAAPGINRLTTSLGPFSESSRAFFNSLGHSAKTTGPALLATQPLLRRLETFGGAAKPFATPFAQLLTSVRSTGGLERLLDLIFMSAGATNGYDQLGHFLRAEGVLNACVTYSITPLHGCSAKFSNSTVASAPASATAAGVVMQRTLAVLKGLTPAQAIAAYPGSVPPQGAVSAQEAAASEGAAPATGAPASAPKPVGGAARGTTYYTPIEEGSGGGGSGAGSGSGSGSMLLNYLLGG
ncbi:MAG: MlaD family protein [Solirubrobacterales bacterium]|nr:MlaD family protein [Solirubrobacterales bacterium]